MHALLRAMFQDLVRNPLTVAARGGMAKSNDFGAIHQAFMGELERTRFVAPGGPSESGTRLQYEFRQENKLPTELFPYVGDLIDGPLKNPSTNWVSPTVERVIFIDDFCGTGQQITKMGGDTLPHLRRAADNIGVKLDIWYLTLLATSHGLNTVEQTGLFQQVQSLSVLDATYRVFDHSSQYFRDPPDYVDKSECEEIMSYYGNRILVNAPFGYGNSQLLLGFHHNVPDNTLPVIWAETSLPWWRPIFERSHKLYKHGGGP